MATKEKGKVNEKDALNAKGESVSDYTEAVACRMKHLATGATVFKDYSHYVGVVEPVDIAFMIEGRLNKWGHAVNKATNGPNADGDVAAAFEAFEANAAEGGWTNREGGNEVNVLAIQTAYAELGGYPLEKVQAAWTTFTDEQKQAIRKNGQVKAKVDAARAAKSAAAAAAAAAPPALPML